MKHHNFRVGDKVICATIPINEYSYIQQGKVYTIKSILENRFVTLIEISQSHSYWLSEFELYKKIWLEISNITKSFHDIQDVLDLIHLYR